MQPPVTLQWLATDAHGYPLNEPGENQMQELQDEIKALRAAVQHKFAK
jgi:hypothetical protein